VGKGKKTASHLFQGKALRRGSRGGRENPSYRRDHDRELSGRNSLPPETIKKKKAGTSLSLVNLKGKGREGHSLFGGRKKEKDLTSHHSFGMRRRKKTVSSLSSRGRGEA